MVLGAGHKSYILTGFEPVPSKNCASNWMIFLGLLFDEQTRTFQ